MNGQDKELSSEQYLHHASVIGAMTLGQASEETVREVAAYLSENFAASPQLPVAEQPAGQASLIDALHKKAAHCESFRATEKNEHLERIYLGMRDGLNMAAGIVSEHFAAAPHSPVAPNCGACPGDGSVCKSACKHDAENPPVAQMSGDEVRTKYLDLLSDVLDAKEVMIQRGCKQAEFSEMFREFASHPSNAVQDVHPDDVAVDTFAAAMKGKLALAREKGRGGWEQCDPADLSRMLREHVEKGDPRDVANFCMFLWCLGQPISAAPAAIDRNAVLEEAARACEQEEARIRDFADAMALAACGTCADRIRKLKSPPQTGKEVES